MSIRLMRCTVAHFAGDKSFKQGDILPEGDPDIIPAFWAVYEIQAPTVPAKTARKKP